MGEHQPGSAGQKRRRRHDLGVGGRAAHDFSTEYPRASARNADEALAFGGPEEIMLTEDDGDTWRRSVEGLSAVWVVALQEEVAALQALMTERRLEVCREV